MSWLAVVPKIFAGGHRWSHKLFSGVSGGTVADGPPAVFLWVRRYLRDVVVEMVGLQQPAIFSNVVVEMWRRVFFYGGGWGFSQLAKWGLLNGRWDGAE